jgi:hypothetical protein
MDQRRKDLQGQRKVDPLGIPIRRPIQKNMVVTPGALNASMVDMKEVLKTQIGSSESNATPVDSTNPQITDTNTSAQSDHVTDYGFEDYEIYLDSTARDQISDLDSGVIQWAITPYNGGQEVKNIAEFYISQFMFPRISYQDNVAPDYFYFRRVFVEIMNTPTQNAIIAPNSTRFHFECEVTNLNSQAVTLVPIKQTFFFRRPIDSLGLIQLRFSVPSKIPGQIGGFSYIKIPKETVYVNLVAGSNPATFTMVNGTTDLLAPIGPLSSGIAVYMSGAATGNTNLSAAINTTSGIYVTNIVNSTTFQVGAIDATLAIASTNILMYVPKNRIGMAVRLTSVQPYTTNFIDVSRP